MKQYTDLQLEIRASLFQWVLSESREQIQKWGIQTHNAFEWLTYTTEELGSLAKAIGEHEYRGGSKEKVVSEAIQVATLALKIAEMFERSEEEHE